MPVTLTPSVISTGYLVLYHAYTCLHNCIPDVNIVQNSTLSQISAYTGRVVSVNKRFTISGKDPICIRA